MNKIVVSKENCHELLIWWGVSCLYDFLRGLEHRTSTRPIMNINIFTEDISVRGVPRKEGL